MSEPAAPIGLPTKVLSPTSPSPASSGASDAVRAPWVDVSRALAMFFIMWLHTRNAPVAIHGAVGGGIGLFFLMAGYFMPREARRSALRALEFARTWLIWMLLPLLVNFLSGGDFEWQRALGWGVGAYNAPMWFLRNLVIFQLMMAALMFFKFLPRHAAPMAAGLICCAYITEWSEHTTIRFNYMMMLVLGFALRAIKLRAIYEYLQKNAFILAFVAGVIILQPLLLAEFCDAWGIKCRIPNIPVRSMSYALLLLLSGITISKYLPKLADYLALAGRCMMFIFVSHVIFYGLIIYCEHVLLGGMRLDGVWTPIIVMAGLTWLCLRLQAKYPTLMRLLGCPSKS